MWKQSRNANDIERRPSSLSCATDGSVRPSVPFVGWSDSIRHFFCCSLLEIGIIFFFHIWYPPGRFFHVFLFCFVYRWYASYTLYLPGSIIWLVNEQKHLVVVSTWLLKEEEEEEEEDERDIVARRRLHHRQQWKKEEERKKRLWHARWFINIRSGAMRDDTHTNNALK